MGLLVVCDAVRAYNDELDRRRAADEATWAATARRHRELLDGMREAKRREAGA